MNKTLTISVIVLVAVIMGMSAIAPVMALGPPPDACVKIKEGLEKSGLPIEKINVILKRLGCPL